MSQLQLPLTHRTALVACSETKSEALAAGLKALGAKVIIFPVISIRGIADKRALDAALDDLSAYSWIIFTSTYGVHYFLTRMEERNIPRNRCRHPQVCAVGPATAAALETAGVSVSLVPREYVAEGILSALEERCGGLRGLAGLRILLPRAKEARNLLPRSLEAAGARVDVAPCYENTLPEIDAEQVQSVLACTPDLLVFTSSSTLNNFVALLGSESGRKMLSDATVAALGPITARTLASLGKQAEIVPRENTIPSLLDAIRLYYQTPAS
jgi:uroporphyrinogen III methyltransferase/synthase